MDANNNGRVGRVVMEIGKRSSNSDPAPSQRLANIVEVYRGG